jgi:modulator of FtsH protease HflC
MTDHAEIPFEPSPKQPWGSNPTGLPSARVLARLGLLSVSLLAIAAATKATMFRVPQNEVGYISRFGQVRNPQAGPLMPGLHFKMPFADTSDTISVSTDTVKIPAMKAFTRDTQEVTLQLSLTYNIPSNAAYFLLFEVGRAGNVDISHNLDAIANDRVRSIVSRRDVTELAGEGRERVIDEIKTVIAAELKRIFRVNVHDVQIPTFDFSPQYKEAINRATLVRAQRLQAEQDRERAKIDVETSIVKAKGDADQQFAKAEGAARAQIMQAKQDLERAKIDGDTALVKAKRDADTQFTLAESTARAQVVQAKAEAEGTKLRGDADASAIKAKIEAAGGVDGYARQLQAQAALKWQGNLPQIMGANSGQMPMIMPLQFDSKGK